MVKTTKLCYKLSIARSSNGRTADSESVNLGSSPSLAAKKSLDFFDARSIFIRYV
jgi:hypothetical protein